ncbi:MAG: hypothetical protein V1740_05265 [Candidatus Woesearchaeota archaeon]
MIEFPKNGFLYDPIAVPDHGTDYPLSQAREDFGYMFPSNLIQPFLTSGMLVKKGKMITGESLFEFYRLLEEWAHLKVITEVIAANHHMKPTQVAARARNARIGNLLDDSLERNIGGKGTTAKYIVFLPRVGEYERIIMSDEKISPEYRKAPVIERYTDAFSDTDLSFVVTHTVSHAKRVEFYHRNDHRQGQEILDCFCVGIERLGISVDDYSFDQGLDMTVISVYDRRKGRGMVVSALQAFRQAVENLKV